MLHLIMKAVCSHGFLVRMRMQLARLRRGIATQALYFIEPSVLRVHRFCLTLYNLRYAVHAI